MAVWLIGNALALINVVALRTSGPVSTGMDDGLPFAGSVRNKGGQEGPDPLKV